MLSSPASPSAFKLSIFALLCCAALYAAWRLTAAVRRQHWRETAARVMYLTGVGIFLYMLWIDMWRGEVPPPSRSPVDNLLYVAGGLILFSNILYEMKPRSPERR
jgi:type VI protein secretion system component VasK